MMKKILVAVDFSDNALNALAYAFNFAHNKGMELHVVYVLPPMIDPINTNVYIGQMIDDQLKSAKNQIDQFIQKSLLFTDLSPKEIPFYRSSVRMGNIISEINNYVEVEKVDLILIGSRGNNKSKWEKMMGTVSTGIAEKAKTPVLIIPIDYKFRTLKHLTYASKLLDADPVKLFQATDILGNSECTVKVIHVNTGDDDLKLAKIDLFKSILKDKPGCGEIDFYAISDDDIDKDIIDFSKSFEVDLLIIYQTHHTLWERLFGKNHTRGLTSKVDWPLLIMK